MLKTGKLRTIIEEAETWIGVTEETEVRIAVQPLGPTECSLDLTSYGVTAVGSSQERPEREDFDSDAEYLAAFLAWQADDDGERVLYLAESQQIGYLPESARLAVGWTEGSG